MFKKWNTLTASVVAAIFFSSLLLILFSFEKPFFRLFHLYSAAGEFRQNQWNRFLNIIGDDVEALWGYGSWTVLMTTYWTVGGIYTFLDVTNKPKFFRRYKVQPGTNEPIPFKNLMKIMGVVLFNQIAITIPMSRFLGKIMVWRGTPSVRVLPPLTTTIEQIILFVLIEEIGFYYSHRLFHMKYFYKFIHKKHHEWTAPISIAALYSHPIEHVISNVLPAFSGVFILNAHVFTAWLWFGLAIAFTLSEHSGYHLPFFPSSEAHDFHHKRFTNCFGVLGILDWLHGTDTEFRKTASFKRHRMLTGITSARILFPDSDNSKMPIKKNQ